MDIVTTGESQFSESYLSLQNSFCCSDTSLVKLIKWVGCTPAIYQGANTIFSSSDFGLCSFYQQVTDYTFDAISLTAGASAALYIDANFLMIKSKWESSDQLESDKKIELGVPLQPSATGAIVPALSGATAYSYIVMKDVFILNTSIAIGPSGAEPLILNNISSYPVRLGIFAAK